MTKEQAHFLGRAIAFAAQIHAEQMDHADQPYILHPLAVMAGVEDPFDKAVAVMHDVIEDGPEWVEGAMETDFPSLLLPIRIISRLDTETYQDFIERIATSGNLTAIRVKLADLAHNMDASRTRGLDDAAIARYDSLQKRYVKAYRRLMTALTKELQKGGGGDASGQGGSDSQGRNP